VALVGETGDKLGKIVNRVDEITVLINDIAAAAERQAANLQQVNASVGEMDRVTQQNAAMVEETTAATRSLADEAGQLSGLVGSFRTRDVTTRPSFVRNPGELRRRTAAVHKPRGPAGGNIASSGHDGGCAAAPMAEAVGQDWSEF
jgi:methyl-accepting chemotaxis protein